MDVRTAEFSRRGRETIANPQHQRALLGLYEGLHKNRISAAAATADWELQRQRGRAIRSHAIENLDHYLEMLARTVAANRGTVYFANDDAEAREYVAELAKSRGVETVIKSKSMVSEEMGLNEVL